MITYKSIPSYWASSQALAHFGLEMIFNSINKPLKGPYFDCWYFLCLASKKTLIDISEPLNVTCILVSGFLMQQLSLQHLNVDVRYNKNAPKELNDCIGGLLR